MKVQVVDDALLGATLARAKTSPRQRINHNFHSAPEDNPHRMLNAFVRGTYCPPHRHLTPPKAESFCGAARRAGGIRFRRCWCVDINLRYWARRLPRGRYSPRRLHSVAPVSEVAVCFEVKPGPYDVATDKEFAPWAPGEGQPGADAYLARLMASVPISADRCSSWDDPTFCHPSPQSRVSPCRLSTGG